MGAECTRPVCRTAAQLSSACRFRTEILGTVQSEMLVEIWKMVLGIDSFKTWVSDFSDQYAIIGGTACDLLI